MEEKTYKGYNGNIILNDSGVIITRGAKGFFFGGGSLRGDKSIPYTSIMAVQLKKAGWTAGYIQLTVMGGRESKSGVIGSAFDENSINFYKKSNKLFAEAKEIIEEKINQSKGQKNTSGLDEIEKLADLKAKGHITEEEFTAKKKQILGI